jgi:hypothetical protein
MSLVNTETGEIVEPLDRAEAERLTTRIRLRLDTIADNYTAVMPLIREAIERQAYAAMGYTGVSQYVSECFGSALERLGVEVRREVVRELTAAGMSTRAIGAVTGTSVGTVHNDQVFNVEHPADPEPPAKVYCTRCGSGGPNGCYCGAPCTPEGGLDPLPEPAPAVTGLDGKTYTRPTPTPRATPRKPLADSFFTALYDAGKKVESLHRLTEDDRWPQNAEKVAAIHRNDLLRINDLLQQVINSLPENEVTA